MAILGSPIKALGDDGFVNLQGDDQFVNLQNDLAVGRTSVRQTFLRHSLAFLCHSRPFFRHSRENGNPRAVKSMAILGSPIKALGDDGFVNLQGDDQFVNLQNDLAVGRTSVRPAMAI
ncbi:MAG: hypothetical protein IBX57_11110 [Gammaproteobacteria bacterium]|nr:hypothetical protein [Gammaproteobacteria bacterium]